ncbi:MAG: sugar transferase [Calothrix sp. MO_167.B12]|nr:sugar transferase [Calothrix sp. MO_167.B12]
MSYITIPTTTFKPDIRSPRKTIIQRGFPIRFLRIITLVLLDVMSLGLAYNLAIVYGNSSYFTQPDNIPWQLLFVTVGISINAVNKLYLPGKQRRNYLGLIQAISLSELFLLLVVFLGGADTYLSRLTFLFSWLFSIAFICTARFAFNVGANLLRSKEMLLHSVFLITEPEEKDKYLRIVEQDNSYTVQGVAEPICLDLKNREATFDYLHKEGIEEVFVSWSSIKNRLYICWNFHTSGIVLRILPNQIESYHPKSEVAMIGEVPCMTIPGQIVTGIDFWTKRLFDLCGATILLILLSPIYLVIAILIKLDSPGAIFFKQKRVGLHGKEFQIWKFRTMVANAEKLQASLEAKNQIKDGVLFKIKDDPRITRVGKFLRSYSLDELPQIFNVLLGQMSLVGPRPLPLRDVEKFQTKHFIRQEVLPGITGLWQVSGRSNIDNFEDGVKLDISYIENWSFWLDIKILLSTIEVVLGKKGAY